MAALGVVGALGIVTARYSGSSGAELTRYALGGRPSAVTVAGGRVWVTDDSTQTVVVLDERSGNPVREPIVVAEHPVALAADVDAGVLWVGHAGGSATAIDMASGEARSVLLEGSTSVVTVAVSHGSVWFGDFDQRLILRADPRTGRITARFDIPEGVVRLAITDDTLWVTNLERTVTLVDLASGAVGEPIEVGSAPIGIAAAGDVLWVANSEDDSVVRIDGRTHEVVGSPIAVGDAPVAVVADRDVVWVVSQDDRSVAAIDAATGRVISEPMSLETRPRGVAAANGRVWVAGVDPGAVVSIENAF